MPVVGTGKNDFDLFLQNFGIQERTSFLDYLYGGCQIKCHVAINMPNTNGKNDWFHEKYESAIKDVMKIMDNYDVDRTYPTYGLNCQLLHGPDFKTKDHSFRCFALNGDIFRPEVKGHEKIIEAF